MTDKINITDTRQLLPLYGNIVVKELPKEEIVRAGIIFTDEDVGKNYAKLGEIVSLGIGELREDGSVQEFVVKVGDTIAYSVNTPHRLIRSSGEDYVVLCEREIYGVYSKADNK